MKNANQTFDKGQRASGWSLQMSSLCPCGSKLPRKKCCLTKQGYWYKKPSKVSLSHPETNFSNNKCLFHHHNNCSKDISQEHYFSKSILSQFDWETVVLGGFPWMEKTTKRPSINSMTSGIMCSRHNNSLSGLDESAGKTFQALKAIGNTSDKTRSLYVLSGEDFEKWGLKCLVGLLGAKIAKGSGGHRFTSADIQKRWLDILIGKEEFPSNWGLFMQAYVGKIEKFANEIAAAPLINKDNQVCGAVFVIAGTRFDLILSDDAQISNEWFRRVRNLKFKENNVYQNELYMTWY